MQILSKHQIANYLGSIGGKAAGLVKLNDLGLKTPLFFVAVDFENHAILTEKEIELALKRWSESQNISAINLWAVRSSAAQEDGIEKSFAGQYKTILNVPFSELADAIQSVFQSYQTTTKYSKGASAFSIIIQQMLTPDFSGVYFSKDPINCYNNEGIINLIPGLGDPLVSGKQSGFTLQFKNGNTVYDKAEKQIDGETFENGTTTIIQKTTSEIVEAISPHLNAMLTSVNRLEKQQQIPLDFEFALEKGQLYWLQMRPITTRQLEEYFEVWDNTSVEANFEGLTLPLSISFINQTLYKAYGSGGKSIGFTQKVLAANSTLFQRMAGGINGALYYNVSAWQTLLYQMPGGKKLCHKLPLIWGMENTPFKPSATNHSFFSKSKIIFRLIGKLFSEKREKKKYLSLYTRTCNAHKKGKLIAEDLTTLKSTYKQLENELGNNWLAPVLNGFYTMLVFSLLKKAVSKSSLIKSYPNYVNDVLFSDGDVISLKLVRSFQQLLHTISENKELKSIILKTENDQLIDLLAKDYSKFATELLDYIDQYGNRTEDGELKMETITYKNDVSTFIDYLKTNVAAHIPRHNLKPHFKYKKVLKEQYSINIIKRWYISLLSKKTIERVKARENYRFMRTETFAIIRDLFMQMGKLLAEKGKIAEKRDVLYLNLAELIEGDENSFAALIDTRKKLYSQYPTKNTTNRYMFVQNKFVPVESSHQMLTKNSIKGTGCCTGLVKGEVVIIDEATDLNQNFNGKILVAYFFQPGWIGLFSQAIGIISERGNLLSHTAIICREMNLPSIVGAKGLMKKVKNGQKITMNGATGIIELTQKDDV